MKILITGGAGFIGSHLCEELTRNSNYEVFSLDNYFTGHTKNHIKGVKYLKGETKDIFDLVKFIPDLIFHLGEYSRVEQSFDDIEKVIEFNKLGTLKVLEFVRKTKAKLIYAGSSTKFGDQGLNANESPYAWSKSSNTLLVNNYAKWFNINHAIVYFYNAYGEREINEGKYATLIALFSEKMKNNLPLTVVKPGTQRRNFTHVKDIVRGLILVANKGRGDGYCIGNKESFSIIDVAEKFGGEIQFLKERKGNRLDAQIDTTQMENLGWKAKENLFNYIDEVRINNWEL